MARLADVAGVWCCAVVAIYVGAMATEGGVLVPYWQSLPPGEFLVWYAANARRLVDFFGPVTIAAVLLAVASAVLALWSRHPGRMHATVTAVLLCGLLGLYFAYFEDANTRFATGGIAVDAVPGELARWAWWHHVRTGVSAAALVTAVLAVRRTSR
jgi:ABC-type Mn2+/Zn2+ transport system permease subunit